MATSSIPWKENAAWTMTFRMPRNLSRPMCVGSKPEPAKTPGFFQY